MSLPATVDDFKTRFARDFVYGTGLDSVRDADIQIALNEAALVFNTGIWDTSEVTIAFLYAAAHLLVTNLQMAGGLAAVATGKGTDNHGGGIINNKSVGQVSVQYAIPQSILESPALNQFMRTDYGLRYLQLITPRLVGNAYVVSGFNDTGGPDGGI